MDGRMMSQTEKQNKVYRLQHGRLLAMGENTDLIESKHLVCPLTQTFLMDQSRVPGLPTTRTSTRH